MGNSWASAEECQLVGEQIDKHISRALIKREVLKMSHLSEFLGIMCFTFYNKFHIFSLVSC